MSVPLPVVFGKYQLLSHIAEGGMADVYLGRLTGPGGFEKRLVIKVIRPELAERPEFCDLFVAEAKITVALTHANIVPVYELGMVEGQYFLAMELVDGPTLHQLVFDPRPRRGGPIPATLSAYIVEQVLRGLDYAHHKGVIHRDLSTANVMCSRDGEVKIVDFGIAAHLQAQHFGTRPRGGSVGYMAPEQQRGGEPDARGDLFAVGVLLSEIVTGRRFAEDADKRKAGGPPRPALPAPVRRIIETATQARPEDRYPDAAAMLVEVSRYLREVDPPTQSDLSRLVRRRAPDERRIALSALPRIITRPPLTRPRREDGPRTRPTDERERLELGPAEGGTERPGGTGPVEVRGDATPALGALRPDLQPGQPGEGSPAPPPPAPPVVRSVSASRSLPASGTVTFASRPPGIHATWRTYAGAGVMLISLGLGAMAAVQAFRPTLPTRAEPRPGVPKSTGTLLIELPPGATLTLDGKTAPAGSALEVAAGWRHIDARAPGHRPMLQDVYVRPGETVRELLALPWSVGHLRLETTPPDAQVLLNGEAQGATPLDLDVPLDRPVTLRVSSKGYVTAVRDILPSEWVAASPEARLGPEGSPGPAADSRQPEMRLSIVLLPLGRGMLTIGATPWAQVFVDGERRGDTPLRRIPLSAGSHALRLYCPPPGCQEAREFRQNLTVEPGKETRRIIDFRLSPPDVKD